VVQANDRKSARLFPKTCRAAYARLPLDRVLRQPGPGKRNLRFAARRTFCPSNVANIVYAADLNCLSVVEYAVDVLQVKLIIVCGHYGCGGVKAALDNLSHGLIDNWLTKIKDIYVRHREDISSLSSEEDRINRMCELNVIEQVKSVSHTTIVQDAWRRGQNSLFTAGSTVFKTV